MDFPISSTLPFRQEIINLLGLSGFVLPQLITNKQKYRNINLLAIAYSA